MPSERRERVSFIPKLSESDMCGSSIRRTIRTTKKRFGIIMFRMHIGRGHRLKDSTFGAFNFIFSTRRVDFTIRNVQLVENSSRGRPASSPRQRRDKTNGGGKSLELERAVPQTAFRT